MQRDVNKSTADKLDHEQFAMEHKGSLALGLLQTLFACLIADCTWRKPSPSKLAFPVADMALWLDTLRRPNPYVCRRYKGLCTSKVGLTASAVMALLSG